MSGDTIKVSRGDGRGRYFVVHVGGKLPERVHPDDGASARRAAKKLGVPVDELRAAVEAAMQKPSTPTPAEPSTGQAEVWVDEPGKESEIAVGSTLRSALTNALAGTTGRFLRWGGVGAMACLDVDVRHEAVGWLDESVEGVFRATIGPLPFVAWRSRGGGLHAIYEADAPGTGYGLTAAQKAALAALLTPALATPSIQQIEVIPRTRRPPGPVVWFDVRYAVANLRARLAGRGEEGAVEPHEVEALLQRMGLERGQRYPHERCPSHDAGPTSGQDPVIVLEDGIHCHRCAGVRGAGWFPWARLLRGLGAVASRDPIVDMAANRVHWPHAALVLEAERPALPEPLRRLAYRALLTVLHDAEVADAAFKPSLAFVRGHGGWLWAGDLAPTAEADRASLRMLPWCGGDPARVWRAVEPGHLDGYTPIVPTRILADRPTLIEGRLFVPAPAPGDAPLEGGVHDVVDARTAMLCALEGWTPAHQTAFEVGLIAVARAQLAVGAPPVLVVTGPTGSGKGLIANLIRGVCGGPPRDLNFDSPEELNRSLGEGFAAGAALLFGDEVGKIGSFWQVSSPLLRLGASYSFRALYRGNVSVPATAAIYLAGSELPTGITTMAEFARRAVLVRLPWVPERLAQTWGDALRSTFEVDAPGELRRSTKGRRFAESWLRWARDTVCSAVDLGSWVDAGVALGATRIDLSDDADDLADAVRALYAVWTSPRASAAFGTGRRSGWLRLNREGTGAECPGDAAAMAVEHWLPPGLEQRAVMARVGELRTANVPLILGVESPLRLAVKLCGQRVWARFVAVEGDPDPAAHRLDPRRYPEPGQ